LIDFARVSHAANLAIRFHGKPKRNGSLPRIAKIVKIDAYSK